MKLLMVSAAVLLALTARSGCMNTTYKPGNGEAPLNPGAACVGKIAKDICPVGTSLDLDVSEGLNCGGEAGVQVRDQSGKVSGVCGVKDTCKFKCNLMQECKGSLTLTLQS